MRLAILTLLRLQIVSLFFYGCDLFLNCALASVNRLQEAQDVCPVIIQKIGQGLDAKGEPIWLKLDDGLEFGEFRLDNEEAKITILKIDPKNYEFVLGNSSQDGREPRPLNVWANEYGLKAAINASMYLPQNGQSTGYMRSYGHENNKRIVERFGGFFVAEPKRKDLPQAAIIGKENPDWQNLIKDYDIVVQNYRMTNAQRKILWHPGGPHYSISAIGEDGSGNILFIHSSMPVEAYAFVQQLLHLPLDIRTILYVEGGAQAGFVLKSDYLKRDLAGLHAPSFLVTGNLKARLPNVLGIRSRMPEKGIN